MANKLIFRIHAIQRMFERAITEDEIKETIMGGEIIEQYPDDKPYPSKLILGWRSNRPIHVVVAENISKKETIVVTVYEPDKSFWQSGFKRRKS